MILPQQKLQGEGANFSTCKGEGAPEPCSFNRYRSFFGTTTIFSGCLVHSNVASQIRSFPQTKLFPRYCFCTTKCHGGLNSCRESRVTCHMQASHTFSLLASQCMSSVQKRTVFPSDCLVHSRQHCFQDAAFTANYGAMGA